MNWHLPKHGFLPRRTHRGQDRVSSEGHCKFDESSGQVYTEKTISAVSIEERNWTRPRQATPKAARDGRATTQPAEGTRSLVNTAIEAAIKNLMDASSESIERLPTRFTLQIWNLAHERFIVPFCVWAAFSKVLHKQADIPISLLRYRNMIQVPHLPLQSYTAPLTAPNFEFLTYLSITDTKFSLAELVGLSSIKNLGILEIVYLPEDASQSRVDDRLVRAWHRAAREDGAFSVLRILKLWNHSNLTENSLSYLESFPALALYDVRGCNFDTGSRALGRGLGWQSTVEVGLMNFFQAMCVERAVLLRAAKEEDPKPIRRAECHALRGNTIVSRIPRADITEFLTGPDRSVSRPGPDAGPRWPTWHNHAKLAKEARLRVTAKSGQRGAVHYESWEFLPYTIFARIGELRGDRDLRAAGVDVDDQAVVEAELVNTVPLACLRLGPPLECLTPSLYNNPMKSFYGSAYAEPADPPLTEQGQPTRNWETPTGGTGYAGHLSRNPTVNDMAFFRVKAPRQTAASQSTEAPAENPFKDETEETGTTQSKRASGTFGQQNAKFMHNKKQKLADVLNTFK